MKSYIALDKNMVVETKIEEELAWHSVASLPFAIHGFCESELEKGNYYRVPEEVGKATSPGVYALREESAGGRVRFSTNSPYIAIRAKFKVVGRSSHLTLISSAGFDLYEDGEWGSRFIQEFRMPYEMEDFYEQIIRLDGERERSLTINFPVHSVVETVEVGLKPGATLGFARPYADKAPIVVYGSSIVHGTGASRPGLTYTSIMSRMLNADYKNIGFSGVARGEQAMAEWLSSVPMSVFVCDYDHNAPTLEWLEQTHHAFYETFRKGNPTVPYIMVTKPDYWTHPIEEEEQRARRDIIMRSYLKAREKGDDNVYFIDGSAFLIEPNQYELTLDSTHPNEGGFVRMANTLSTLIKRIYEKQDR